MKLVWKKANLRNFTLSMIESDPKILYKSFKLLGKFMYWTELHIWLFSTMLFFFNVRRLLLLLKMNVYLSETHTEILVKKKKALFMSHCNIIQKSLSVCMCVYVVGERMIAKTWMELKQIISEVTITECGWEILRCASCSFAFALFEMLFFKKGCDLIWN